MKITRNQLKQLIKEVMLTEADAPPWLGTTGYSRFQSDMNEYLDESGWEPGVLYFWNDEDVIVILPDDDDDRSEQERADELLTIIDIGSSEKLWNAPQMSTSVVELEDGSWAIKLNAQMTQDRI